MSAARPRLVLASASPRRSELLASLGLTFEVRAASVDESARPGEGAAALVERLAREKATAVAGPGELVLGADTVVALDGAVLGKPAGDDDAAAMLRRLAGREHEVLTGLAFVEPGAGRTMSAVERTRVRFTDLTAAEVDWYVRSGEARDKAGAYGVQGRAALFVSAVIGNYSNVVGLPLPAVRRLCREAGHDLLAWSADGR